MSMCDVKSFLKLFVLASVVALMTPNALAKKDSGMHGVEKLLGHWEVSLFYSATAEPSKTKLEVSSVEDGVLKGTFYGSEFELGRVTLFNEVIIFTGVTRDNTGQYISSGRLQGDAIKGQTLAQGRQFLMAWRATRVQTSDSID